MIEVLHTAAGGLTANKLRSGLTILGLMIGVGSVIVLISVGTGSSAAVTNQIDALGSNILTVTAAPSLGGLGLGGASSSSLTLSDAGALKNRFQAPDVKTVSPVVNAGGVTLTYNNTTYQPSSFVGTTPTYQQARDYTLSAGSWFTKAQEAKHARVMVVGPTVVSELFGGQDPVGETIQVNGTNFEVIGVTNSKGSNGTSNGGRRGHCAADGRRRTRSPAMAASTRSSSRETPGRRWEQPRPRSPTSSTSSTRPPRTR